MVVEKIILRFLLDGSVELRAGWRRHENNSDDPTDPDPCGYGMHPALRIHS